MIRCLLLGASCAGKSSLGKEVCQRLGWEFSDLDAIMSETYGPDSLASRMRLWGPEGFYTRSLRSLEQLAQGPESRLVAVGAASQLAAGGSEALLQWPSVCLWVKPEHLWERSRRLRQDPRSFDVFCAAEFNPWREALYDCADAFVELTDLPFSEAVDKLWTVLTELNELTSSG